jgi:hypothetical protein
MKKHKKFQHTISLHFFPPETVTITTTPQQMGINNFRYSNQCNEPDSKIITDCCKAKYKLSELGYKHSRVNHSIIFRDGKFTKNN